MHLYRRAWSAVAVFLANIDTITTQVYWVTTVVVSPTTTAMRTQITWTHCDTSHQVRHQWPTHRLPQCIEMGWVERPQVCTIATTVICIIQVRHQCQPHTMVTVQWMVLRLHWVPLAVTDMVTQTITEAVRIMDMTAIEFHRCILTKITQPPSTTTFLATMLLIITISSSSTNFIIDISAIRNTATRKWCMPPGTGI